MYFLNCITYKKRNILKIITSFLCISRKNPYLCTLWRWYRRHISLGFTRIRSKRKCLRIILVVSALSTIIFSPSARNSMSRPERVPTTMSRQRSWRQWKDRGLLLVEGNQQSDFATRLAPPGNRLCKLLQGENQVPTLSLKETWGQLCCSPAF